jgi:ABC-2 type transport system ATP-binding protein
LSTHILPEVEQTCQQVIIINKGKLVATDSVSNLQSRARGAEAMLVEVASRDGALDAPAVRERLEKVAGVSRVTFKEKRRHGSTFEVENRKGSFARGDLARAVVEAGWDLNEMRPSSVSLEEIFLQLTREQSETPAEKPKAKDAAQ